jgi:hypothetical protein
MLVEPYFTKPSDAIVNSLAVIIALLGLADKNGFVLYKLFLVYAVSTFLLSILALLLKDRKSGRLLYSIVEIVGKAKVIFSFVYIASIYSYYGSPVITTKFLVLLLYWIIVVHSSAIEKLVNRFRNILKLSTKEDKSIIGQAIGCSNPFLYKVESINNEALDLGDIVISFKNNAKFSVGLVTSIETLLSKRWFDMYLLSESHVPIEITYKGILPAYLKNSVFCDTHSVYKVSLEEFDEATQLRIKENDLYMQRNDFIGFTLAGSDINTLNFSITREDQRISEGKLVKARIENRDTLFQIVNGKTDSETLEQHQNHGYLKGIAKKLGMYDMSNREIVTSEWVPNMYTPVFSLKVSSMSEQQLKENALSSIGFLPNTNYAIPIKDIPALVTHNTAILGILGIGKSCLAFEIIKKVSQNDVKVICIDITNQYVNSEKGLPTYYEAGSIVQDIKGVSKTELRGSKDTHGSRSAFNDWGNIAKYRGVLKENIKTFLDTNQKVLVLNPDLHPVTKAASRFNIEEHVDLTVAEKTRVITEEVFKILMEQGESDEAKVLLVYEEAHSLIPEWNSIANEGDKSATNGTAKVILQGRKYGLGCLVITQRTANISKSILNQCNTIFALRIFDDTGKNFLENYIGNDYASTLPTLEERHAIVIGKGLKLKQPAIIQLNDCKYFKNQ